MTESATGGPAEGDVDELADQFGIRGFPSMVVLNAAGHTIATFGLMAINVAVWLFIQGMGSEPRLSASVCELGLIPGEFFGRDVRARGFAALAELTRKFERFDLTDATISVSSREIERAEARLVGQE